ncbi:MAG TPA: hypothetical protein VGB53_05600 [Rubricoccaceae bacterium]|jgi:hypothetical protein
MAELTTAVIRARVWFNGQMYTPEEAAQAQFVLLPTGEAGQLNPTPGDDPQVEAPRLNVFDSVRAFPMLSTLAHDADGREVFVGDVIEELTYLRRYVVQHGYAFVSEVANVGFFGSPLGEMERRLLRISDNLVYYRVTGTMYDEDFDSTD